MEPANVALTLEVDEEIINDFKKKLGKKVLLPGDGKYDAARKIWNRMIDKKPTMIVQCTDKHDVTAAVNFARTINLPIAVKPEAIMLVAMRFAMVV
jgi:hypothetical protein